MSKRAAVISYSIRPTHKAHRVQSVCPSPETHRPLVRHSGKTTLVEMSKDPHSRADLRVREHCSEEETILLSPRNQGQAEAHLKEEKVKAM